MKIRIPLFFRARSYLLHLLFFLSMLSPNTYGFDGVDRSLDQRELYQIQLKQAVRNTLNFDDKLKFELDFSAPNGPPTLSSPSTTMTIINLHRRVDPIVQKLVLERLLIQYPALENLSLIGTPKKHKDCKNAVKVANKAEKAFRANSAPTERINLISAVKKYDELCLTRVPTEDATRIESNAYEIIGVIGASDPGLGEGEGEGEGVREVWCVATYIGNSQIITARHCFFGDDDQFMERRMMVETGTVLFQRLSLPKETYRIRFLPNTIIEGSENVKFEQDAILLSTDRPVATTIRPTFTSMAKIGMNLLVMGYVHFSGEWTRSADSWSTFMRKGALGLCAVETVVGNCILHTCTTESRFSGTPMISISNLESAEGQLAIVGLHVEAAGGHGCYSSTQLTKRINLGISSSRIKELIPSLNNNIRAITE